MDAVSGLSDGQNAWTIRHDGYPLFVISFGPFSFVFDLVSCRLSLQSICRRRKRGSGYQRSANWRLVFASRYIRLADKAMEEKKAEKTKIKHLLKIFWEEKRVSYGPFVVCPVEDGIRLNYGYPSPDNG